MKKTVAIVPAKGFSRRVPRKNMKELHGHPLLHYILKSLQESPLVDEVYVSTDDEEIAMYAKSQGALVPYLRDKALSGDSVHGTEPVLDMLKKVFGESPDDSLYCLRALPPYPFVTSETITEVIKKSHEAHKNVVSVVPLEINEFHLKKFNDDGTISSATNKEAINFQIDDAPELFALSGAAQCMPARQLLELRTYQHGKPLGHPVGKMEAFELDTSEAFALAEQLFPILYKKSSA